MDNQLNINAFAPPLQWGDSQIIAKAKQPRSSNLELYRIVCMLMIVAHHFVMNSGLADSDGPLMVNYTSEKAFSYLYLVHGVRQGSIAL